MSSRLEDIIKTVHREKGDVLIDVTKGEVVAVYSKEDKLAEREGCVQRAVITASHNLNSGCTRK